MSAPWVTIWPIVVGMGIKVGRERKNVHEPGPPYQPWAAQQGIHPGPSHRTVPGQ